MLWDVVMWYDKNERPVYAGRTADCKAIYWEKLVAILEETGEYETSEHKNKNQPEIPFNY